MPSGSLVKNKPFGFCWSFSVRVLNMGANSAMVKAIEEVKQTKAVYIHLNELGIKEIPADLFDLTSLMKINLSNNKIKEIPGEQLRQLTELEMISFYNNKLKSIPDSFNSLPNLKRLILSYNEIAELPSGFWKMRNLQYLDLSLNKIVSLPAEIGSLKELAVLHLSDNELKELPKEIGNLEKLQKLVCRDNKLELICSEIGDCKELVHLNVQGNKLKNLPVQLKKTDLKLKHSALLVAGNPLAKCIKTAFKTGGVHQLFEEMNNPTWEDQVQDDISTGK